jgi:FkbM family methyltransferase
MVTSEHLAFVSAAYNLLLDRDPEPAGLKHWSECLANGLSKTQFLRAVISSNECQKRLGSPLGDCLDGLDLVLSIGDCQFRVPAGDQSLVPYLVKDRQWEPTIVRYLMTVLVPSDIFADVGANIGYYSVMLSPLVKQVVAFEPVKVSYDYCKTNIELNRRNNVVLHNLGLWHSETDLEMTVDRSALMTSHVGKGETVHCVTLDQLNIRPTAIKMDIEGAESFALEGMRKTLESSHPIVIMELNRPALARYGVDSRQVWDFFARLRYSLSVFQHEQPDPLPIEDLHMLAELCPSDSLIDILAVPARNRQDRVTRKPRTRTSEADRDLIGA